MVRIISDKYNPKKTWIVKRSRCGHYYLTQLVNGKKFGRAARVRKSFILSVLDWVTW